MEKIQTNKIRMFGAIDELFDDNSALFAKYDTLVKAHQKLKIGLSNIVNFRQIQEVDNSGLTKSKQRLNADLSRSVLKISGGLQAYATEIKDLALKTKTKYTASDLKNSPDPTLIDIGKLMRRLADPLRTELTKFSVVDADFDEIDGLLAAFKTAIPKKKVASSISKVSTSNIGDEVEAMIRLLKDEIDSLMLPFQFTQPDFYNAYRNARLIVGYTGPKPKTDKTNQKPKSLEQPDKNMEQEKGKEKETER